MAAQPTFRPIAPQPISVILALRLAGWLGWLLSRVFLPIRGEKKRQAKTANQPT